MHHSPLQHTLLAGILSAGMTLSSPAISAQKCFQQQAIDVLEVPCNTDSEGKRKDIATFVLAHLPLRVSLDVLIHALEEARTTVGKTCKAKWSTKAVLVFPSTTPIPQPAFPFIAENLPQP